MIFHSWKEVSMLFEDIKITTDILLKGSLVFTLLDSVYIPLLVWRIKPGFFMQVKWPLAIISGLVWFGIWKWVLTVFWESVYSYVFPTWTRNWIPLLFGLLMAVVSFAIWILAKRSSRYPVVAFCLLGGVWGILTHTWAIYRGIMTKPPMLQGASPYAALLIAFFEFIFYWCVIMTFAGLAGWMWQKFTKQTYNSTNTQKPLET